MEKTEKIRKIRQDSLIGSIAAGAIFLVQAYSSQIYFLLFSFLGFGFVIWNSIGTFFYGKAVKIPQNKSNASYEKAMPYFEKAIKWGGNENCQIVVGTLMLQHGDMEKGREILEFLSEGKNLKTKDSSKVSLSMYCG